MSKSVLNYLNIFQKVYRDKAWYLLWNFDLFTPVNRIYPQEDYYSSFYQLLLVEPSKVTDQIYLGSAFNAADHEWLKANNITDIVNVTPSISNYYSNDFNYHTYNNTTDHNVSSLEPYYQQFYDLITNAQPNQRFLVHCFAGKSRSSALILYYLIRHNNWTLAHALSFLKSIRPFININTTFMEEIIRLTQPESSEETDISSFDDEVSSSLESIPQLEIIDSSEDE